ncbi:MAG: class I SAM-dependent methyltransferase [Candidatus Hodarchaeales archaeon]|jgi:ubiquinone/menaquinone biosynthesis C-methylase UbiE
MSNSLLSGGEHYNLLINWDKRLSAEIPFLTSFFDYKITPKTSILSLGCGTGKHLVELTKKYNCSTFGLDIDSSMISEARKSLPKTTFFIGDFLSPNSIPDKTFDLVFSLGNSLGLIASSSTFSNTIERLSQIIRRNGTVIFHLLNTMIERNGWSKPRTITTPKGEIVFLRGFTTSERFIHPEIITLYRENSTQPYQLSSTGRASIPRITLSKMNSLLKENSFKKIRVFGDYYKSEFQAKRSTDMIFVAEV